jgi:cytosine/adenosine deaminase-related metal-dependent hydrolase
LPTDGAGAITLPSPNYLELVADCIKQQAGSMVDEVLVQISRSGTTAMVMYKSNKPMGDIDAELDDMRVIICQCLKDHPSPGLTYFRIKAYATNDFLTRLRGGGEPDVLGTAPASGGGDGYSISTCL